MRVFDDRRTAGRALGEALVRLGLEPPLLVLGLARGGVPVAAEVARLLAAPLDVLVVRKVGMPGQEEFAIGALAPGGVLLREAAADLVSGAAFDAVVARERAELERRERTYRGGAPPLALAGRTVVLVDDGLATGATMLAAVRSCRAQGATRVVVAVPVTSSEAQTRVAAEADRMFALETPAFFFAVGQWYREFSQVSDDEVRELLAVRVRPA